MTSSTNITPGGDYYNTFTKVGEWDVKDIGSFNYVTFMLTNDGKLYYAGRGLTNPSLPACNAFTQIYQNYKFHDIVLPYANTGNATLVAIAEYLGEVAE